jgi:hypothetical protein
MTPDIGATPRELGRCPIPGERRTVQLSVNGKKFAACSVHTHTGGARRLPLE